MEHVIRSAVFSALQSAQARGATYNWLQYTTLNEKFNVLPADRPATNVYPTLGYVAIGRGGMGMNAGADGQQYPAIKGHKSTDTALFDHMPFALRLTDNDLPVERRSRYAMRVSRQYGGQNYWAYYLKRVDFSQADTDLFIKHVLPDGSSTVTDWVPSEENLNPTPVDLTESGTNLLAGYSVMSSTIVSIPFDTFDINEIRNASQIIRNATGQALISEMAICTGATKTIQASGQVGTFPFLEAIGVQIASFIKTLYPLDFIQTELTDQLELGISEPLFKLEGQNG